VTKSGWWAEIRLLALWVAAMLLAILSAVPWLWVVAAGLLLYAGWQVVQLFRLWRYLREPLKPAPQRFVAGVWREVFEQISRLHQSQQSRQGQRSRFIAYLRRFLNAARLFPSGIMLLDPSFHIRWCNAAAIDLLALPQRRRNRLLTQLVHHPVVQEYLAQKDFSDNLEIRAPGSPDKMIALRMLPLQQPDKVFLLLIEDVTRIYHVEQSQQDFVANVSHELRTPLTVIAGHLEILLMSMADKSEIQSALNAMQQQTDRMRDMISDLLSLARLETQRDQDSSKSLDVPQMVNEVVADLRSLAEQTNHSISLDIDPQLWLFADDKELHSLISNLIMNAIKHTPASTPIQVYWQQQGANAELCVSDAGEGIAARHIPRLTERFYQADAGRSSQSRGSGLGLSIVKRIMVRHGGEFSISSELGKGCSFRCLFPAHRSHFVAR